VKIYRAFATVFGACLLVNLGSYFLLSDGFGIHVGQDGMIRVGLPFVFFERGGFSYRSVVYGRSLLLDLLVCMLISIVITAIWRLMARAESSGPK